MIELKATFLSKSLHEYFERVKTAMKISAQRMKIGVTDEGINSLSHQVLVSGSTAKGSLSFKEYMRMVDMGAGRSHPLGGLSSMVATLQSSNRTGLIEKKDKTRRAKKFYSKVAYGNLTWLENQILYGFTEQTIASLKKEMKS